MDYIAGSFYDGFLLYAIALEETLAEGGEQNDGLNITMRTQNRRFWGRKTLLKPVFLKSTHSYLYLRPSVGSCSFSYLVRCPLLPEISLH